MRARQLCGRALELISFLRLFPAPFPHSSFFLSSTPLGDWHTFSPSNTLSLNDLGSEAGQSIARKRYGPGLLPSSARTSVSHEF